MSDKFYKLAEDGRTTVLCESKEEWSRWAETHLSEPFVAMDTIGYSRVTTMFDGEVSSSHEGPPLLFFTLASNCPDTKISETTTWEDAEREHARVCDWLREEIAQGRLPERVITRTYYKPRTAHVQADPLSGAASQHAIPDSADPEAL